MANRQQEIQSVIRYYKRETGETDVDMGDVVRFAVSKGWKLPKPIEPVDRLIKEFSRAAREEVRIDTTTNKPYRANHVTPPPPGSSRRPTWFDIDEHPPRKKMLKSLQFRRQQGVDASYHIALDQDHWNAMNPDQQQIEMDFNYTEDVKERKAFTDGEAKKKA